VWVSVPQGATNRQELFCLKTAAKTAGRSCHIT
jgi:hypothetical protein